MAGEWKDIALEDIADEITVGYVGPMASEYVENGVPFLRSLNVEPLRVNKNDLKFITPEFHHKIKKSRLTPDDVVIVRTGKPGACSVVPEWLYDANCSDLVIVRCGDQLDKRFLAFYVNTMATNHVAAHLVGAVQQHFNVGAARTMRIKLPPLGEQKRIAHILGTLDDKIELNRRMNATLEGMAQALFKSWFIDFDPVIDNILVKNMAKYSDQNQPSPPAPLPGVEGSSESPRPMGEDSIFDGIPEEFMNRAEIRRQALADGTANREAAKSFPATFQQTEAMGWIPERWKEATLSDLLDVKYGKDHKKLAEGGIPVYGSGGLMRYADKALYSGESVLIPRKGTLSNILYLNEKFWTVDTMFYTTPKCKYVLKYAFYHLKSLDFASMNVGSAVPSMTTKVLNALPIVMPAESALHNFDSVLTSYFDRVEKNNMQSKMLSKLRDTLLPKLISGEFRIKEAEKIAEEIIG